jgi:hypothetical protein
LSGTRTPIVLRFGCWTRRGHLVGGAQQEGEAARRPLADGAELPVVHPREPSDLREILADERQVMPLVHAAKRTDAARRIGVADPASQRIARIGGIRYDAAAAQDCGRHADQSRLRMGRMHRQQLGHRRGPSSGSYNPARSRSRPP